MYLLWCFLLKKAQKYKYVSQRTSSVKQTGRRKFCKDVRSLALKILLVKGQ